ncbi:hypothetical protein BDV24DRAFT_131486 [Aspergillus arachidicola]|uniref:Uncharacterized protein n=1 Tax=Aspergillus arachidicola TaxID=656916 RepID=A0A5N6YDY0_9EURO|nr:hypothetical protein BDV24DRAFT_131486 [Aspergillus arachidicola]
MQKGYEKEAIEFLSCIEDKPIEDPKLWHRKTKSNARYTTKERMPSDGATSFYAERPTARTPKPCDD